MNWDCPECGTESEEPCCSFCGCNLAVITEEQMRRVPRFRPRKQYIPRNVLAAMIRQFVKELADEAACRS